MKLALGNRLTDAVNTTGTVPQCLFCFCHVNIFKTIIERALIPRQRKFWENNY